MVPLPWQKRGGAQRVSDEILLVCPALWTGCSQDKPPWEHTPLWIWLLCCQSIHLAATCGDCSKYHLVNMTEAPLDKVKAAKLVISSHWCSVFGIKRSSPWPLHLQKEMITIYFQDGPLPRRHSVLIIVQKIAQKTWCAPLFFVFCCVFIVFFFFFCKRTILRFLC